MATNRIDSDVVPAPAAGSRRDRTRQRLVQAADELFRERGYPATTVAEIATRAGVSLQTLYLAWGSKSALFRAAANSAATGSATPLDDDEWRRRLRDRLAADTAETTGTAGPAGDPGAAAYLEAVAQIFVEVAARSAVYWQMRPVAAAIDPEINATYEDTMRQRRITLETVASHVPRAGLRGDHSLGFVTDVLWALASPEMFSLFTVQAGRSADDYRRWLTTALIAALCDQPDDATTLREVPEPARAGVSGAPTAPPAGTP